MINYIEKGMGLHEAIRDAGHRIEQIDGVWQSSDDEAVQAIIDSYDPTYDLPNLNPPQFIYMLALSGLEDIWDGLEVALKDRDRELYAKLKGSKVRGEFSFDETMVIVQSFTPFLATPIEPDELAPHWKKALTF